MFYLKYSNMIISDIAKLTPKAQVKVKTLLALAKKENLDAYVFESFRSKDRQYELFGKWRTALVLKKYGVPTKFANPTAKIVTWTLQSKHLTGEAVDIVFDWNKDPKIKVPTWSGNYQRLVELGLLCWLRNLAPIELCHFEDDWSSIDETLRANGDRWAQTKDQKLKDLYHFANETIRSFI